MKALIRNYGETVKESDNVPGINWATGYPLTSPEWEGGHPYTLVENYVEPKDPEMDGDGHVPANAEKDEEPSELVVTIGGKTYTKEELRDLLNSV